MKAQGLQENLRRILWQRIESGQLTGLKLAEQTGFQQAHVSNFLNRKRSLSIEGLDRFLSAQHLSVLDLLDQAEISRRASIAPPSEDAREGMSMYPRLLPGATVLIDRHYNALKPYRRGEQNMYAVEKDGGCAIKYVQVVGDSLVLRPQNNAYPVELISLEGKTLGERIVGRVAHVGMET